MTHDYSKKVKTNLNSFRKQYLNKKNRSSKGFTSEGKIKKARKSISKRRKDLFPARKPSQQNIKMRTVDFGDSRNQEELASKNNSSYNFHVRDQIGLKKSSTVSSLFGTQNHPLNGSKQQMIRTNEDRREKIDFYSSVFDENKANTQEVFFSDSNNLLNKF